MWQNLYNCDRSAGTPCTRRAVSTAARDGRASRGISSSVLAQTQPNPKTSKSNPNNKENILPKPPDKPNHNPGIKLHTGFHVGSLKPKPKETTPIIPEDVLRNITKALDQHYDDQLGALSDDPLEDGDTPDPSGIEQ